jgi:thiol-disulfide isomerase/thioredoxin
MSGLTHPARQAALVLVLSLRAWAGELEAVPGTPQAPTLALADPGGKFHALTDNRGRVVLVNFWASWCPPCLHEMPSLQRLAEATASWPFKVLAVNVGETPQRAEEALKRLGYKETLLLDRDQTA